MLMMMMTGIILCWRADEMRSVVQHCGVVVLFFLFFVFYNTVENHPRFVLFCILTMTKWPTCSVHCCLIVIGRSRLRPQTRSFVGPREECRLAWHEAGGRRGRGGGNVQCAKSLWSQTRHAWVWEFSPQTARQGREGRLWWRYELR